MKIFNEKDGMQFIISSNFRKAIVPVFGAGFTYGAKAYNGTVPNGAQLIELMRKIILSNSSSCTKEYIDGIDFSELSECFFDNQIIKLDIRLEFIRNYFTSVVLQDYKIDFLKLWDYIYTINIDDAIESNTKFKPIITYSSVREKLTNLMKQRKYVLKLHGDANHEIEYKCKNNIIFSDSQYIASLKEESNNGLINSIFSDYKQKNILFIGCSLKNESDLKYIYNQVKDDMHENSYRIQLRISQPSSQEEQGLKRHGINAIIFVENYDAFYKNLVIEFKKAAASAQSDSYKYKNPKTSIISDRKNILADLAKGRNPFDEKFGGFKEPNLVIERTILQLDILRDIDQYDFFVIQGTRFCGKTLLINSIIKRIPKFDFYYFPSEKQADELIFSELIKTCTNSIFVFDSNSMTPEVYNVILNKKQSIINQHNKIIIASNTNEDFFVANLNARHYKLNLFFDDDELDCYNKNADNYAFIRRKRGQTNLDYAYKLLSQNNMHIEYINTDINNFTIDEQTIILMLCVFEKIYFHEIISLNILQSTANSLVNDNQILFTLEDCDPNESNGKSVKKIIHNSRSILLHLIKNMDIKNLKIIISNVVKNLYINDKQQYKQIMMFDTLNQLFCSGGAGHLIEQIYESLEAILYSEPHFWLQRAKSIYRLHRSNKERLLLAASYAIKAIEDSPHRLRRKAMFTCGLIYCYVYMLASDENEASSIQEKSISMLYESVLHLEMKSDVSSMQSIIYRDESVMTYNNIINMCVNAMTPANQQRNPSVYSRACELLNKIRQLQQKVDQQRIRPELQHSFQAGNARGATRNS